MISPKEWTSIIQKIDKRFIGAALYGLSYLLRRTAPSICMADLNDIDTDVSLMEREDSIWKSALYIFDSIEGGVGYAEKIFEKIDACLELCLLIINECNCHSGCPSCVPPLPPGVTNEDLEHLLIESNASIMCTKSLLVALVSGEIMVPKINITKIRFEPAVKKVDEDVRKKLLKEKLGRAATVLRKKRERLH